MNIINRIQILFFKFLNIKSFITLIPFDTTTEDGRSKERYRKVVLSTGSSVFHKVITIVTGLISIPLTINYLGAERFGLWMTITSILTLLTFADLGLGNGLVNAVAKSAGKDDLEYSQKAISSTFFMLLVLSFLLFFIFYAIYPFVNWASLFNVKSQIAINESGPAMAILMVTFLLNMSLGVIEKTRLGLQEGYQNNLWLGLGSILGLGGVLIAINYEWGLPYLVGLMVGGPLVALTLNGFNLFIKRPYLFPLINNFDLNISKTLLNVGLIFFLLQLFTVIGNSVDNIIIAQILGASSVATYAIVKKLFLTIQFTQFIIAPLWPAFVESIARKDYQWAENTLIKILKFSMFFGGLSALPLLIFGSEIIEVWVNKDVIPPLSLLVGFFLFTIFQNYGGSMSVFLNNDKLIKKQLIFVGLSSVASVILQIILCHQFGISGIIFGLLGGYLIFYVVPAYKVAFGFLEQNKRGRI